jgi:peptidoglycan/LPS O-acetylase OafA/YrhL
MIILIAVEFEYYRRRFEDYLGGGGCMNHSKYRPDIDGLRAISILSFLCFHIGFKTFSGGFVGVDVFFVISGFLITRLIRGENSQAERML